MIRAMGRARLLGKRALHQGCGQLEFLMMQLQTKHFDLYAPTAAEGERVAQEA